MNTDVKHGKEGCANKTRGVYFLGRYCPQSVWENKENENAMLGELRSDTCCGRAVFWTSAARARTGAVDGYFPRRNCGVGIATGFAGRRTHSRKGRQRGGCGHRDKRCDGCSRANDERNRRGLVCDRIRCEGEQTLWIECERLGTEGIVYRVSAETRVKRDAKIGRPHD